MEDLQTQIYIVSGVLGGVCLLLLVLVIVLFTKMRSLNRRLGEMQSANKLRVQKLKMNGDKNHAFHNPTLSQDEELSKRGYSMYAASEPDIKDIEAQRGPERQPVGPLDELTRELDSRHRTSAPPFLLQAIQENKRKSRNHNPVANETRQASDTNPNFIY